MTRYVLSDTRFADTKLTQLTPASILAWRRALLHMKPSSLNRLLNDLRAGITAAMPAQTLPPALRAALRAEQGATEAREIQVLGLADLRRLLQAAEQLDANFGQLVLLLAVTGARFSQIVRLRVSDVQLVPGRNRLMVPASAKGRIVKAGTPIPVPISDDIAAQLRPLTYGRMGHETLLSRRPSVPCTHVAVKEAVFPFARCPPQCRHDPRTGDEIDRRGDGPRFQLRTRLRQVAARRRRHTARMSGTVFLSVKDADKRGLRRWRAVSPRWALPSWRRVGRPRTSATRGLPVPVVNKVLEGRPHCVDAIRPGDVQLVINTASEGPQSVADSFAIRRSALTHWHSPLHDHGRGPGRGARDRGLRAGHA